MATNFPTSLDTFTNPTSGNTLDSPSHSGQHSDINDAVEAIEAKLGIGSSTAGSAVNGYALVSTSGGTTSWTTIGTAGISSGTAVNNSLLTANGSGGVSFTSPAGLVLLNTTSFSAVASQAVNSVFNATYDIYKIFIYFTTAPSNDCDVFLKLRSGGTDSSASYTWGIPQVTVGGSVSSFNGTGQTTGFLINRLDSGFSGYSSSSEITLQNPFVAKHTSGQIINAERNSAGTFGGSAGGLAHIVETSYDGLNIIASAGTISGVVSIYGVNK